MLNRIIDVTLRWRWLVLTGIAVLLAMGGYALYTIPVEAFPDLTNNQVVVVTNAPSLPPTEVEQLVTYPIERAMLGLPDKEEVRVLVSEGQIAWLIGYRIDDRFKVTKATKKLYLCTSQKAPAS